MLVQHTLPNRNRVACMSFVVGYRDAYEREVAEDLASLALWYREHRVADSDGFRTGVLILAASSKALFTLATFDNASAAPRLASPAAKSTGGFAKADALASESMHTCLKIDAIRAARVGI